MATTVTTPPADDHQRLLAGLNDRQCEAVTAPDGPTLVIAGPGSGKTRVICARIAHLVRTGRSEPDRIAAITFTRKAADEMTRRLRTMLPAPQAQRVWISTFHRLCGRLLREHGDAIGIPADFRIVDGAERIGLMRQCMFDARVDVRVHKPQALLHRISTLKNRMREPAETDAWEGDEHAGRNAQLAAAYQAALDEANGLDFDDMLLCAVRLLHESAEARRAAGDRFPRILVDEYQDTNLPQYVLVRQMAEGRDDVFVVGDPDQAIYGWRGAELQNILSFPRDFPAARRIDLQLAYRSGARLLEAASAMIRSNSERLDHRLRCANPAGSLPAVHHAADPAAEARFAVERAAARIRRDDGEVAVLYRTNAQSGALENAFRRAGIRYRITGGESFYNRPEVLDALACLQAACDPDADDEAMRRFSDLPPHPRTGRKARAEIDRMPGRSFWNRARDAARSGALSDYHTTNLRLRIELATTLRDAAAHLPLDQLVDEALARTGYRQAAAASADADAGDRLDNLAELAYDAGVFSRDNDAGESDTPEGRLQLLAAFLGHCRSMRTPERAGGAGVRVTLSTLHGAKGLEFDTVIVAGFDAEHLPHRRTVAATGDAGAAIEEERRLAYVGMTRARTELYLSVPAVTGHGTQQRATAPSPFLAEIPDQLRTTTSPSSPPQAEPPGDITMGPLGPERSL
jgi:DNA helicase-2/ATP-dependent DNA helicase PcrA